MGERKKGKEGRKEGRKKADAVKRNNRAAGREGKRGEGGREGGKG